MGTLSTIILIGSIVGIGFGTALHLSILEKGDLYGIQDLADNATVVYENNLISSIFMSGEDGDWGEHDGEDGDHDAVIEHASVGFKLDKVVVDPTPKTGWTGDEYFDNRIKNCEFHSKESIDEPICLVCKLTDTSEKVIAKGLVKLPHGYTASSVVPVELCDGGVDVQKPVGVKIDVVQFIAKEEEHEHSGGFSTITTQDGGEEDSVGTADSEGDGDSAGSQDSDGDGDSAGSQDSDGDGDSAGSQDSDGDGDFVGCFIDEEPSEDSESSADSDGDGDSAGSQDSDGDGDSSGSQDSEGDASGIHYSEYVGDASVSQDSDGDGDSAGSQDSEGDGEHSVGTADSDGDGDSSGSQDSEGDGDTSGSE